MKKLFISQSYSANPNDAHELAKKYSRQAVDAGYIPISPVLMFHYVFRNDTEYHDVLYACFSLIKSCDAIWVANGLQSSKGVAAEVAYAKGLKDMPILFEL